ncbi:hypothetical protein [Halorubrum tailed virus BLv36]|nr:hypothetical protein [Halorubrum tailed virus BLv36]
MGIRRWISGTLRPDKLETDSVSTDKLSITEDFSRLTYEGVAQSIPNDSLTVVEWDTAPDDNLGAADPANNQFVIPEDGTYYITGWVEWQSDSGWSTGDQAAFDTNGIGVGTFKDLKIGTERQRVVLNDYISNFNANDTVDTAVLQSSGSSQSLEPGSDSMNLMIARLG